MKPTLCYLLPANNAIQDKITGKWSFIDLFSFISIPHGLDYTIQTFYIAGRVNNVSDGENISEVSIVNPSGKIIFENKLSGVLSKGDVQFVCLVPLLKIEEAGRYYLKVAHNGTKLPDNKKFYFDVVKQTDEA